MTQRRVETREQQAARIPNDVITKVFSEAKEMAIVCVRAYQGRENWGEKPIERNGSPSRERLLLLLRFCFYRERATSGTRIQG